MPWESSRFSAGRMSMEHSLYTVLLCYCSSPVLELQHELLHHGVDPRGDTAGMCASCLPRPFSRTRVKKIVIRPPCGIQFLLPAVSYWCGPLYAVRHSGRSIPGASNVVPTQPPTSRASRAAVSIEAMDMTASTGTMENATAAILWVLTIAAFRSTSRCNSRRRSFTVPPQRHVISVSC